MRRPQAVIRALVLALLLVVVANLFIFALLKYTSSSSLSGLLENKVIFCKCYRKCGFC